jgi:hypothetical protein
MINSESTIIKEQNMYKETGKEDIQDCLRRLDWRMLSHRVLYPDGNVNGW